jgi:hypothetical protein
LGASRPCGTDVQASDMATVPPVDQPMATTRDALRRTEVLVRLRVRRTNQVQG